MNPRTFSSWSIAILLGIVFWHPGVSVADEPDVKSIEQERLETMRRHVAQIEFRSNAPGFPKVLVDQPLFRYDDLARGYVDGAVWRLGATGRPKAIVTTELHPKYGNSPRIVCDYLSLSEVPFTAAVAPNTKWTPSESAVKMSVLPDAPKLAPAKSQRLFQLKKMADRFSCQQTVEGQQLELRLLPRPIDRYQVSEHDDSDAALFLFVSGRNPGVILLIEATEKEWQYGVGRLSGPSALSLRLDGQVVWNVDPSPYEWPSPYTAANFPIDIPGFDSPPKDSLE